MSYRLIVLVTGLTRVARKKGKKEIIRWLSGGLESSLVREEESQRIDRLIIITESAPAINLNKCLPSLEDDRPTRL